MRVLTTGLAILGFACLLSLSAQAGGEKDKAVTLKGKITCAKCDLGEATACETVIVTKRDKKDITIWFDAAGHKKHHSAICSESKAGSVTGVLKKEGKKEFIVVKDVKFE